MLTKDEARRIAPNAWREFLWCTTCALNLRGALLPTGTAP
jgi:hypothetical protein